MWDLSSQDHENHINLSAIQLIVSPHKKKKKKKAIQLIVSPHKKKKKKKAIQLIKISDLHANCLNNSHLHPTLEG